MKEQGRDYRDWAYDPTLDYVFNYPCEFDGVTYEDGDAVPEFVKEMHGGHTARNMFNLNRIKPAIPYGERIKKQGKKRKRKEQAHA